MSINKAFRYSLEALIKKRSWDLDVQRTEESRARQIVEEIEQQINMLENCITGLEQDIRDSRKENTILQPDKYHATLIYINDQRKIALNKKEELRKAVDVHEQILAQVEALHKSIKGLEKHKEKKRALHDKEVQNWVLSQSDELWLMRQHRMDQ